MACPRMDGTVLQYAKHLACLQRKHRSAAIAVRRRQVQLEAPQVLKAHTLCRDD